MSRKYREEYVTRHTKLRQYHLSTWNSWRGMIARCYYPTDAHYCEYGERGIMVEPRWRLFDNFLADMGDRPSSKHSIDRIDNSKGYSKENCRWVLRGVQCYNRKFRKGKYMRGVFKTKQGYCMLARINGHAIYGCKRDTEIEAHQDYVDTCLEWYGRIYT